MATLKVNFHASWIDDKSDLVYTNNFQRIINFYLFQCPNENVSSSGIDLKSYGWKNPWKNDCLRLYLYSIATLENDKTLFKAKNYEDVSKGIDQIKIKGKFYNTSANKVVFYTSQKYPDILTIIFYIRCAFAHGRFLIKTIDNEVVYFFEAINPKKESVLKARLVLKEKTLIDWIDILKNGPNSFNTSYKKYIDEIREFILFKINSEQSILKEILFEKAPYLSALCKRVVNQLLKEKKISCKKNQLFLNKQKGLH